MTEKEKKDIERVLGKDYDWLDIPAIWRQEWLDKGLITEEENNRLTNQIYGQK